MEAAIQHCTTGIGSWDWAAPIKAPSQMCYGLCG